MKFFCDHEELITQLKLERDNLKTRVAYFEGLFESLRDSFQKLAAQSKQAPPVPRQLTKEDLAQRLHLPVSLIDHIDLDRLGVQLQDGIQSQRR